MNIEFISKFGFIVETFNTPIRAQATSSQGVFSFICSLIHIETICKYKPCYYLSSCACGIKAHIAMVNFAPTTSTSKKGFLRLRNIVHAPLLDDLDHI